MISDVMKSKRFKYVFSILLGFAVALLILVPLCKGADCIVQKAPPPDEVKDSTYQLGNLCYQFKVQSVECPNKGIIEPFYAYINKK